MTPKNTPASNPPGRPTPTQAMGKFFEWSHLPVPLQPTSQQFQALYNWIEHMLPDGPEKTTAIRKLLEAKDCAVRTHL